MNLEDVERAKRSGCFPFLMSQDVPEISFCFLHSVLRKVPVLGVGDVRKDLGAPNGVDVVLGMTGKLIAVDFPGGRTSSEAEVIQCLSEAGSCDPERWNKTHSSGVQAGPDVEIDLAHFPGPWPTADEDGANFVERYTVPGVVAELFANISGS